VRLSVKIIRFIGMPFEIGSFPHSASATIADDPLGSEKIWPSQCSEARNVVAIELGDDRFLHENLGETTCSSGSPFSQIFLTPTHDLLCAPFANQ
jgi:hypothetical protein